MQSNRLMTSGKRMFWVQKHLQLRAFSAGHGHGHDDHHDDHHGHHVETADPNHKFIESKGFNKRTLFFDGLKGTAPTTIVLENPYRHHNDLPLLHHGHVFSGYAFAQTFEEDPKLHDEPYGYELGDDPFEEQGQGDYPWLIVFASVIVFVHFCHAHFRFDRRKVGEVLYHQRLTAFQIEDEIRKMRLRAANK